jgi:hypothetical protein
MEESSQFATTFGFAFSISPLQTLYAAFVDPIHADASSSCHKIPGSIYVPATWTRSGPSTFQLQVTPSISFSHTRARNQPSRTPGPLSYRLYLEYITCYTYMPIHFILNFI